VRMPESARTGRGGTRRFPRYKRALPSQREGGSGQIPRLPADQTPNQCARRCDTWLWDHALQDFQRHLVAVAANPKIARLTRQALRSRSTTSLRKAGRRGLRRPNFAALGRIEPECRLPAA